MRPEKPRAARDISFKLTDEMKDLMARRTRPFLDGIGLQTIPISRLLQEAYLQGLTDAVDAMNAREAADV